MAKHDQLSEVIEEKLATLPAQSGCYIFRDREGTVLYVGKAKSLRSRVRSYFQEGNSDERAFIPALPRLLGDLETVVTESETEAAILENSLIKEHRPRFNVKLRDDKEYLNLRIDRRKEWPRLELVRRPATDGAQYFGPFRSATAARKTLHLVEKHFQLRTCTDRELKSRQRPCIQYQIQRCPAPCVYEIDEEAYSQQVKAVELFLAGRHDELSDELKQNMLAASQSMEFEVAAIYRDQLNAVEKVRETQRVVAVSDIDQDVLGLFREADSVELSVVYVRQGRVVQLLSVSHSRTSLPDDEIVASFLREHYAEGGLGSALIPEEVIVPMLPDAATGVEDWLNLRRQELSAAQARGKSSKKKSRIIAPSRGPRAQLLSLARENAAHAFAEKMRSKEDMQSRLRTMQEKLRLPSLPRTIECCDISHLGGEATVGSVVCLRDGVPYKRAYKAYRVKSVSDGDDYEAMFEVLSRRFSRGRAAPLAQDDPNLSQEIDQEQRDQWTLPDLFVVDGGRGQLGVALAAASDLGLEGFPIVGLAKERETKSGEKVVDRVYLPGQMNPLSLRPNTPELFLLARARDEAHRFANYQRERIGKKRRFKSKLDEVPGIGPQLRQRLLKEFGSLKGVRQADDAELLAIQGISARLLDALRDTLGREQLASQEHESRAEQEPSEQEPSEQEPSEN
ncbi:MAG: excinuclease ABC subunit UvrC [Polyangiaceae bacterium]|nr:excinuclease ABC subunit UvrC [Polyangiaceae bacterium]